MATMTFAPAKHVRIKSLKPGTHVLLRFTTNLATSAEDSVEAEATFIGYSETKINLVDKVVKAVFEETTYDGRTSKTVLTQDKWAQWTDGVSLVSVVGIAE